MKPLTLVTYVKSGTKYEATLPGRLTPSQIGMAMLQRGIGRSAIRGHRYTTIRDNR